MQRGFHSDLTQNGSHSHTQRVELGIAKSLARSARSAFIECKGPMQTSSMRALVDKTIQVSHALRSQDCFGTFVPYAMQGTG